MNKIAKFKKALEEGLLQERLINAYYNFEKTISIKSYRYQLPKIQKQCSISVLEWYTNKKNIESVIRSKFGNFSKYSDSVDKITQNDILSASQKCLVREFDLLGSGPVLLKKIDWHTDFKSGFKWEKGLFYKDYNQIDFDNNADVKIPRELSRCHHFLVLGQAYLITKDEKYTKEFLEQILDWINENPLMKSINWGCTMDVAIRVVNWIWALGMFLDSKLITDDVLKKIFISFYEHGFFIYRNPEKAPLNNHNHYISDLVGQIYLGVLLKGLPETSIWLRKGIDELFREMRSQILPSGPTYERSTNYHRLVLELFTSAIILLKKNNFEIPSDIWYRLEKMYEFVIYYLKPDGFAPIIGDQDDGRVTPFGIQKNIDHRYLLTIASVLFDKPEYKKFSNGFNPDCFFIVGESAKIKFDEMDEIKFELKSKSFPDAGFFILRKNDNFMFVNHSGKSRYSEIGLGTHTHSDLLSFELVISGKTFLVDPGTYVYSENPKERMLFRSSQMHNTVTIDGESQNILDEKILWDFKRNAIPKINTWKSDDNFDIFEGEHSGYQRLNKPVVHRRNIVFNKNNYQWKIKDFVIGEGEHFVEIHFHFDIDIDFEIKGKGVVTNCLDNKNISLVFESKAEFKLEKRGCWVSKHYGIKTPSKALVLMLNSSCPIEIQTIINAS